MTFIGFVLVFVPLAVVAGLLAYFWRSPASPRPPDRVPPPASAEAVEAALAALPPALRDPLDRAVAARARLEAGLDPAAARRAAEVVAAAVPLALEAAQLEEALRGRDPEPAGGAGGGARLAPLEGRRAILVSALEQAAAELEAAPATAGRRLEALAHRLRLL